MKRDSWIIRLLNKFLEKGTPRRNEVRVQRMCPFCKLITPSHRPACLECGMNLSPVPAS